MKNIRKGDEKMIKTDFMIRLKDNCLLDPAMPRQTVRVVEAVYNRNNNEFFKKHDYSSQKEGNKHTFCDLIVLKDCDFSNQPLTDNNCSPAIVMGVYNIKNTKIDSLFNAPRFAMGGAVIEGTPLAEKLGKNVLSGAEYHKLWVQQNENAPEIKPLTHELFLHGIYDTKTVHFFSEVKAMNNSSVQHLDNQPSFVILGDCDFRGYKKLASLAKGPALVCGNIDISGTSVCSLKNAIDPACFKGELIFKETPLADLLGCDKLTHSEYTKTWERHNDPQKPLVISFVRGKIQREKEV